MKNFLANKHDSLFRSITFLAALLAAATVLTVIGILVIPAIKAVKEVGLRMLFSKVWNPVGYNGEYYGILPFIAGSLWVSIIAMFIAVPISFFASFYASFFIPKRLRDITEIFFGILAGIPSVVMGLIALTVLSPLLAKIFHINNGLIILNGGIILAIMVLPTIIDTLVEAMKNIPSIYYEGALALGASKWEAIYHVVFRFVIPTFIASIILAFGRVIGETMAVIMAIGNVPLIPKSPLSPGETLTGVLAIELGETVVGSTHYNVLFFIGLVLAIFSLITSILVSIISNKGRIQL